MIEARNLCLGLFVVAGLMLAGAVPVAAEDTSWFVSLERNLVAPVKRGDANRLVEAGTIETDGFSELIFSLGGEFKEAIPESGTVGAVLIPDIDAFIYLLRSEGEFVFPLEAKVEIRNLSSGIFVSEQQRARVAFPRYRVYLYNETTSGAMVSLFVYRTR
jgi:hypothetical protein